METEDLLISTLSNLCHSVRLQGSLLPDEPLPDHFFTFWNNASDSGGYFDNSETRLIYQYTVYFYSIDPEKVYAVLREAIAALKNVGFIISGDGHSINSGVATHDARAVSVQFIKQL